MLQAGFCGDICAVFEALPLFCSDNIDHLLKICIIHFMLETVFVNLVKDNTIFYHCVKKQLYFCNKALKLATVCVFRFSLGVSVSVWL